MLDLSICVPRLGFIGTWSTLIADYKLAISVGFTLPVSEASIYVPLILHIVLPLVANFVLSWTRLMRGSNHLYGVMVSSRWQPFQMKWLIAQDSFLVTDLVRWAACFNVAEAASWTLEPSTWHIPEFGAVNLITSDFPVLFSDALFRCNPVWLLSLILLWTDWFLKEVEDRAVSQLTEKDGFFSQ